MIPQCWQHVNDDAILLLGNIDADVELELRNEGDLREKSISTLFLYNLFNILSFLSLICIRI